MTEVVLFDEKIILDKTIFVTLDNSITLFDFIPISDVDELAYGMDFDSLCKEIKERKQVIITPITKCVSAQVMSLGYDIVVQSKDKVIRFSDLLMGTSDNSFKREIRPTQNWEKMLYSGCFDLDIPDWR